MTEVNREQIIEQMFPNWREHLRDGKVIDNILDGLSSREIVLNKCSRPGCNNVTRPGLKTCAPCAVEAVQYTRTYLRRKMATAQQRDS